MPADASTPDALGWSQDPGPHHGGGIPSSLTGRRGIPADYRLFQAADFCCTIELLRSKDEDNALSSADLYFFESVRKLRRDYLKQTAQKRLPPP